MNIILALLPVCKSLFKVTVKLTFYSKFYLQEPPTKDDEANSERSFQIAVGDKKTLCCPIKGYPPPIVMWEKNGVLLQTKVDKCYRITSATDEQFGNYTCSATDGTKSVGPYSFSLTEKRECAEFIPFV